MSANDRQLGGTHYQQGKIQHWDWAANLRYLEGNATKYLARHREKGGALDIAKALHYIEKIVELDYPDQSLTIQFLPKNPTDTQNPYAKIDPDA